MQSSDQKFHNRHEELTDRIYDNPDMLPHRYVYVITNKCNLNCYFCSQKKAKQTQVPYETWISLTDQLPEYARVTITGGEPFLHRNFRDIFSHVAGRFNCNVISNGLLLNEELIDFLLSYPNFRVLSLSVDNIGNTMRDVPPEKWEHLLKMTAYFKKRKREVGSEAVLDVKTLVLEDNYRDLFDIYVYLNERLGCDTHVFQLLKGSELQHSDFVFRFEDVHRRDKAHAYKDFPEIVRQFNRVGEYNLARNRTSYVHPKIAAISGRKKIENIGYINAEYLDKEAFLPCKFPWSSVHVNYDGNIFPCLAVPMGNIGTQSLAEIIRGEAFKSFKDALRREKLFNTCNRCGWLRPRDTSNL